MEEKEQYYYQIRELFNKRESKKKTVYFLFLMKSGFNGVYRENKKGYFNVPYGKKEYIKFDYENLKKISELIQDVEFYNLEYTELFELVKKEKILKNSFLYCDPPYLPEDEIINQKQLLYTNKVFNHKEFVYNMKELTFAKYMISMSESDNAIKIYEKYGKMKKYKTKELMRTINPRKSFKSTELTFSNYEIKKDSL